MKTIVLIKNYEAQICNIRSCAKELGVNPNTVSRWVASGDSVKYHKGFIVYLKPEQV